MDCFSRAKQLGEQEKGGGDVRGGGRTLEKGEKVTSEREWRIVRIREEKNERVSVI